MEVAGDFAEPEISIPAQDTLSCLNPVVLISGLDVGTQNDFTVTWTTDDGAVVADANSISSSVNELGYYEVEILDTGNGCSSTSGVFVEENDELNFDLSKLEFPNVITPNGKDGNEVWQPFLTNDPAKDIAYIFEEFELKVYNRWGKTVFESESPKNTWKTSDMSEGVYFYHIQYKAFCSDGSTRMKEGWIHLMR